MLIMNWIDFKYEIFDIETYLEEFLYVGFNTKTKVWVDFEISSDRNDLSILVKHLLDSKVDYFVGFNTLNFDAQVLQYILDNHQKWIENDFTWDVIVKRISRFASRVIEDTGYGLFPPYRESLLWRRQIDLFRVHHFDNEAKRVSLKWLEFMLDLEDIEVMPVDFKKIGLTQEDRDLVRHYCYNDVKATVEFFELTVGNTTNDFYKGKNKIQDRFDVMEEFGFREECLNWSDVKIGDEINLKGYMELTGLDRNAIYDLKKKRGPTKPFTFGECIPDYVNFETKEFNDFYDSIKKVKVSLSDEKQKFPFTYKGTTYSIAKGGIHSTEKKRVILPKKGEVCKDADVGSQYPNALRKRKLAPSHLGIKWNQNFDSNISMRLSWKKKGKDDKRYKGLAEMMKLALNGGGFGKTNEKNSWQYDPKVQFSCTIGNEFEVLMLIERMELKGIHVVSANTDGIVCLYREEQQADYDNVCKWWESVVGNTDMGQLEYAEYESLYQTSVNSYIAVKKGETGKDRIKKKGSMFATDHELHKNKSRRVVALALEEYFVNSVPVEETIQNHTNIFDFCIGVKSSANYNYLWHREGLDTRILNGVVRYFVSKDGGSLLKTKREGSEATGPEISQGEADDDYDDKEWKITIANHINKSTPIEDYNIDYEYYIRKAEAIIKEIQNPNRKKKGGSNDKNQLGLF